MTDEPQPPQVISESGIVASNGAEVHLTAQGGVAVAAGRDVQLIIGTLLQHCGEAHTPSSGPRKGETRPYPGLRHFDEHAGKLFHGRETETQRVLDLLVRHPISGIVGSSGSGKSSLLAAGVAHALSEGKRPGSERWSVQVLRASGLPVDALCAALGTGYEMAGHAPDRQPEPDALRADPALFGRLSARLAALTGERVVWLLDQFEEFLTPGLPAADVACVARAVLSVRDSAPSPPVHVVVAVRTDLSPRLEVEPELAAEVSEHQYWLLPLAGAGLRDAVHLPAKAVGLSVEDQLVDRIKADAAEGPGTWPLIAYALERVWERDASSVLTLAAYEEIGGIGAALKQGGAQDVWNGLTEPQRATARRILVRLAHVGSGERPTRRVVFARDLVTEQDDATAMVATVEAFVQKRLLVVGTVDGEPTVEVAHEVLLEKWEQLRDWLKDNPAAKQLQDDVTAGTTQWLEQGKDEGFVLGAGQLRRLERLDPLLWPLNGQEQAYVAASRRVEERARRTRERARVLLRRWEATVMCLVLAVAVAAVLFRAERRTAQAKTAVDALRLSAQARSAAGERRDVAALLGAAAVRTDDSSATRAALMDVLAGPGGQLAVHRPRFGAVKPNALASAPASDGTLVLGCSDGTLRRLDPVSGAGRGTFAGRHGDGVSAVALGGGLLVSGDAGGAVLVQPAAGPKGAVIRLRLPGGTAVTAVAVDAKARVVLAGGKDGVVARWTVEGRPLEALELPDAVTSIAVHRPGARAAVTTARNHVLEVPTASRSYQPVSDTSLGAAADNAAAAVPGGGLAVVDGAELHLWGGQQDPKAADAPRSGAVVAVAARVYVGDDTGRVRAWSAAGGIPRPTGEAFTGPPGDAVVALATDGKLLACLTREGRLVVWDLAARRSPAATPHPVDTGRTVTALAHGPDGTLAAGDSRGSVRLTGSGPYAGTQLTLPGGSDITGLAWTGPATLAAATADGALHGVDVATGTHIPLATRPSALKDLRGAPDGTVLAVWEDQVLLHTPDGATARLKGFDGKGVRAVALGPRGEVAVSHGTVTEPRVLLWTGDATTTSPRALTTNHRLYVAALAFSPDGRTLATGSDDRTVALWDVRTGHREGPPLAGHTDTVRALAWSTDGRLASGAEDGTVRLWDTRAPDPTLGLPLRYAGDSPVTALSASPHGRELAAANGGFTVTWPFAAPAWTSLACVFAADVRTSREDVAGYAGGAYPKVGCSTGP
ncbi:hypothetical protein AB0D83_35045 [Streptomyces decoyicus]|uniref:nSTAND1 domain-containing NTPase n=1 Tax=Streptomyces decoyicus TaxID=249567 RepID=UPI0033C38851